MSANKSSQYPHIAGIDGMRAIAVMAVIVFHFLGPVLPGGFVGVDVFFVISGYVVTGSLLRTKRVETRVFLIGFYARRIVRIYPALILCALVTALAYTMFVPQAYISESNSKTGLAAFFGLSNFALILFDDGYFSPRVEFNAFTHTWSLAVEEQFYLVFPLLLLCHLRARGEVQRQSSGGAWALVACTAVSLLYSAWETSAFPVRAYYLLPSRFWELGAGALLALWQSERGVIVHRRFWGEGAVVSGIAGIVAACFFTEKTGFPFPGALLPVASAVILLVGITSKVSATSRVLLENPPTAYIGKISYSLYLWHWPVLVLLRWTVCVESGLALLAGAITTGVLAAASFHLVEDPVRNSRPIHARSRTSVVIAGLALISVSCATAAGIFMSRAVVSRSVTKDPSLWQPDQGWATMPTSTLTDKPTLFLLGDSHAWAYSGMAALLRLHEEANVSRWMVFGCSNATLRKPAPPECAARMDAAVTSIGNAAKPGDFVLLGALRVPRLGDQWVSFAPEKVAREQFSAKGQADRAKATEQADQVIDKLERAGLRVILDAPKPVFRSPPFRCSDWFNRQNPICAPGFTVDRHDLEVLREPAMQAIATLQRRHPRLIVWDNFDVLCPGERCSSFDGDRPLFFDGDHLSGYANRLLYPHFRALLVSQGLLKP